MNPHITQQLYQFIRIWRWVTRYEYYSLILSVKQYDGATRDSATQLNCGISMWLRQALSKFKWMFNGESFSIMKRPLTEWFTFRKNPFNVQTYNPRFCLEYNVQSLKASKFCSVWYNTATLLFNPVCIMCLYLQKYINSYHGDGKINVKTDIFR